MRIEDLDQQLTIKESAMTQPTPFIDAETAIQGKRYLTATIVVLPIIAALEILYYNDLSAGAALAWLLLGFVPLGLLLIKRLIWVR